MNAGRFDDRQGYCSHYATALVVMARSLGIPARLAAGYSSGEYDVELRSNSQAVSRKLHDEEGLFTISRSNGHAWPQVFFPEYGWVEFEPTAAQPVIVRPHPIVVEGAEGEPQLDEEASAERSGGSEDVPEDEFPIPRSGQAAALRAPGLWRSPGGVMATVVVLGILAVGAWTAIRWWIGHRFTPAAWAYARLMACGRWLSYPLAEGQTPHQYAQGLAGVMPQAEESIQHLVELYVSERFGQRQTEDREAEDAWRDLRLSLLRSWLQQRWAASPISGVLRAARRVLG